MVALRLGGWLALDGVTLANLSDAIPAQGGQDYELSALVGGEAEDAGYGRLPRGAGGQCGQ